MICSLSTHHICNYLAILLEDISRIYIFYFKAMVSFVCYQTSNFSHYLRTGLFWFENTVASLFGYVEKNTGPGQEGRKSQ